MVLIWRNSGSEHFVYSEKGGPTLGRVSPWWMAEGYNVYVAEIRHTDHVEVLGDFKSVDEAKRAVEQAFSWGRA